MRTISLLDVKSALKDARFRDSLPESVKPELIKYLGNPNCACNVPFYRKLITDCKDQLLRYFPGAEVPDLAAEEAKMAQNTWTVINCNIDELEKRLKALPPGRKQLELARYEDQVTVVVNELGF